jgi:hypothetical protein
MSILKRADISNLKVLIVQFSENDFEENKHYYLNKNHLKISGENEYIGEQKYTSINNYPGKPLIWFFVKVFNRVTGGKTSIVDDYDSYEKYFFNALTNSTISLDKYIVIVLGLPGRNDKRPELGIKSIYLPLPYEEETRIPIDSHLNAKGHQVVAENILNALVAVEFP